MNFVYLDPGFGGMLLQVILAVVAVSGGILYSLRRKIRSLFSKKKEHSNALDAPVLSDHDKDANAIDMIEKDAIRWG